MSIRTGLFITGSDTGVGKTWVGCQLTRQLRAAGCSVKVRKPVESGCPVIDGERVPQDGLALLEAGGNRETLQTVTPHRFLAALAPDRAAHLENRQITLDQLESASLQDVEAEDFLLVEGAGGFYSPLCDDGLNADLARRLGLEVIIVAPDRLGGINQALLTLRAVRSEGLTALMIVLNSTQVQNDAGLDNRADLARHCDIPVLRCEYDGTLDQQAAQLCLL